MPTPDTDELRAVLDRASAAVGSGRREGGAVLPLGPKAQKTRSALLRAAQQQLLARGYVATSVEHIHEAAGVSLGTFYQYFRDKSDVVRTLVGEAIVTSAPSMFPRLDLGRTVHGVRAVIEGFVRGYASTAPFQQMWEQATHVDPELARLRRDVSQLLDGAVRDAIVQAQAEGLVDAELDAGPTSRALAAMVDRYCYVTFVVEERPPDAADEVVDVLVRLWTNALGLRAGRRSAHRGRRRRQAEGDPRSEGPES